MVEAEGGDSTAHLIPVPVLGKLLLRLLKYYGEEHNPATTGLSVRLGGPFPLRGPGAPTSAAAGSGGAGGATGAAAGAPSGTSAAATAVAAAIIDPLTIHDPFNDQNNVGRSCYRFFQVQQVFRDARKSLLEYAASTPQPWTPGHGMRTGVLVGATGIASEEAHRHSNPLGDALAPFAAAAASRSAQIGGLAGVASAVGAPAPPTAIGPEPSAGAASAGLAAATAAASPEFPVLGTIISALKGL